jgi:uncharacterized membrane protein required for colicin V production
MEINWTVLTYIVIVYFAISGFSRGWWKEAIITVVLAIFIFLLQNPNIAQTLIDGLNSLIATIWSFIPTEITPVVNTGLATVFAVQTGSNNAWQADASDPGTWLTLLAVAIGIAILFTRFSFNYSPTGLGSLLGGLVGALNGFLIINLVREYLDGRALPGQQVAYTSELTLVGGSSFGPASQNLSIQVGDLPRFTVLDSILPWLVIGAGIIFLVAVLRTRIGVARSADGRKVETRVPPFYRA